MIYQYKFQRKKIYNTILICTQKLFFDLHKVEIFKSRNLSNLYKDNLYRFYFLNEYNKYILIHGLITKANRTNIQYPALGRSFLITTIISNEYVNFYISMDIPTLRF